MSYPNHTTATLQQSAQQARAYGQENPDRDASLLEGHVNRLNASAKEADLAATRLSQLADRLIGLEAGNACKDASAAPSPTSAVGKLSEANDWLDAAQYRLRNAISRLEQL